VQRVAPAAAAPCVLPDPGNRYLLVPCRDGNCVLRLPFDAVGGRVDATAVVRLEQHPGAGPRHVAFHPSLDSVYLLNESDGSLVVYPPISSIQAPVQVCDARLPGLIGPAAAADIHLTPDGRFLYTSVRASNTIAGFAVEPASGRLIHVGHWPTETHPRGLVISPCGQWLVAAGLMSHGLSVHAIDQTTGALALRHRVESPGGPNWMAFITSA
jgi:6-phosphogluconolactonase